MQFVCFVICCAVIFIIWYVFSLIAEVYSYSNSKKDIFSGGKAGDIIIERSDGMKEEIRKICMKVQGKWVEMPNIEGVCQIDKDGYIIDSYIREKKNKEEKNMREIKVGDKIKIISAQDENFNYSDVIGNIYIVKEIRESQIGKKYAELKNSIYKPYLYNCELVNGKEKQFTKSDLKNGDIVELRNGDRYILIKNARHNQYDTPTDIFMSINKFGSMPLSWYSDSLLNSNGDKSYDIMKISDSFYIPNIFRTHPSGTLVVPDWAWKREETEEMTLEEVCKELGKDIKIVKEH